MRLRRHKAKSELCTEFADSILENLETRKCDLLKHPAMLCAIYLDHRVYKQLNETEIQIAKTALANLHQKICNLKSNARTNTADNSFNDSLEDYFSHQNEDSPDDRAQIMELLDAFRLSLQYDKKDNQTMTSFTFWEEKKLLFPPLYEIACVINAIPPSQATVERAFSTLKYIFGEKRTRLIQQNLENILWIKLNDELSTTIDKRDVDAIVQKYRE